MAKIKSLLVQESKTPPALPILEERETKMNIYEKLQKMRAELQHQNLKKSGKNKFIGYDYYELSDILPVINDLQSQYKTCSCITFKPDQATLTIYNAEKPEESIEFYTPIAEVNVKGASPIQTLGAMTTYIRRYLYMTAFEIVEHDYIDSIQVAANGTERSQATPVSPTDLNLHLDLKKAIVQYAQATNRVQKEVAEELKAYLKKELKAINDEDRKKLLSYIRNKLNEVKGAKTV